ncbi:hypothetical protein [Lentzea sp. NPDC003310]|uniref:hypothetical protein n=1 Tax=Lentzea sp. NPDC003310 TaxID=3154447 RepID=UPI0033B28665
MLGWEYKRHATGELHRLRQLAFGDADLAVRGVHCCEAGMWHLTVSPTWRVDGLAELRLPQPQRRPPHVDAPDRQSYLDEIVAVVLDAIRDQGTDLVMPSLTAICDRYQTGRAWTWRLRRALTEPGWLRRARNGYITQVPGTPRPSIGN